MSTLSTPAARYIQHLDQIFGQEPLFYPNESLIPGLPNVTTIVYKDIPEPGFITAFTYGLSLADHPAWKYGHPELCITVESEQMEWAHVLGYVANKLRGKCPFTYGETIRFGEKISPDSDMDAFYIFAPAVLERTEYTQLDIGTPYPIHISALYPMYESELSTFHTIGLEQFWKHPENDIFNVNRTKIIVG